MALAQKTIFQLNPDKIKSIEVLNITQHERDSLISAEPDRYKDKIENYKKSRYTYLNENNNEVVQDYYTDTLLLYKVPVERLREEIKKIGKENVSWYDYKDLTEADLRKLREIDSKTFKDQSANYRSITIHYTKNGNQAEYTYYEKY